ncbi:tRNA(Met) cytidine acetyltransferase TmcA [Metallosphaera sp. J1]|uniref:tRNA(Met) cytidine acetyltransferase TmcA n=1 Tax=Metallosphaera javensis (ex Hofmann et al. 2022) TaxID=99938 RepID=UPI001EE02AF1|nr:GNAT family N-acetyltransferase [Metallosphaera javensis (ex Hofmann et al. 2022)]MCG3108915.1 tRNA(Met) cytidine acetyltransferase TmcA [Metallosphaera javensis (ex Hofmann et al. 2022)]
MKSDYDLQGIFRDAITGNYRNLVFIEGDYREPLLHFINEYLKVEKNPSVGYYFHPWIQGSKERLGWVKSLLTSVTDIDYSSSERFLGSTFDLSIIDAVDDFRPSYVARAIETVRGGGLIIIYTNNLEEGKLYKSTLARDGKVNNLFEERLRRKLLSHRGILYWREGKLVVRPYSSSEVSKPKRTRGGKYPRLAKLCRTDDQVKVLDEIDFLLEDGKKLLVVTAPRGRGKSASVGLALPLLISQSRYPLSITVTSPTYWSGAEVMRFSELSLKALGKKFRRVISRDGKVLSLETGESRIRWLPPDLAKDQHGDILVVDEAAALGREFTDYILRRWDKVALVTTVHGYEGSGKIFLKMFESYTGEHDIQRLKLDFPIRYSKGDPVERFLNDTFLLNAEANEGHYMNRIVEMDVKYLFEDEKKLASVYGILVTAHYRNTPDDLMMLGDMAFQRLFVAESDVGVAQIVEEGGLSPDAIQSIAQGEENLGHLIPQRLIKYSRMFELGELRGWRVMRIAVAPSLQGRGIGSQLLREIEERAVREGVDWMGSSFLANYNVIKFWAKNGYIPLHVSTKKNESLGGYSVIVMKPFSSRAREIAHQVARLLKDKLLRTTHQVYFNMDPRILVLLLKLAPPISAVKIPDPYLKKLRAYLEGILPYNSVAEAVHLLGEKYFKELAFDLDDVSLATLVSRTYQGRSWYHAGISLGMTSSQVERKLKETVRLILEKYQLL